MTEIQETSGEKRVDAKEQLLISAEKLFSARGYDAVSTRDIAEDAGVNLAAIQYHFGSKGKLFVATVNRLMGEGASLEEVLTVAPTTKAEAITQLEIFISHFLDHLLRPTGPQPCRLMFREILTETTRDNDMFEELVESVVTNYITPVHGKVTHIISTIAPELSPREADFATFSVIGQCTFYVCHQPFVEKMLGIKLGEESTVAQLARHVSALTLRGLGVEVLNEKKSKSKK